MAESKEKLEEILGRKLQAAQVEQLMLNFIVYQEVLLNNRFNAGMSQMLYQFSTAPTLDYIAALVAVERLPAASAGCEVEFTLIEDHGHRLIPAGTRVASSDRANIFYTNEDFIIAADNTEPIIIRVTAATPGKGANGCALGSINTIMDPLPFVSTVSNTTVTSGGSDPETDEQLRERIKLAPSQYSAAGSRSSYEFYAKSANPLITDVSVTSTTPGEVIIVPLTEDDDIPEEVLLDVEAACNDEKVRPLTDKVDVRYPKPQEYSIKVNITLYVGADSKNTKSQIEADLKEYAELKRAKLGQDIIKSHIVEICRLPDVYDVEVVSPSDNIVVSDEEFAKNTGIEVIIQKEFSRG